MEKYSTYGEKKFLREVHEYIKTQKEPNMDRKETDIALVFKALSDVNRLKIIKILEGGEQCACRLLDKFNITQPTLSHHMKILCDCKLVNSRREGKWMLSLLIIISINPFTFFSFSPANITTHLS